MARRLLKKGQTPDQYQTQLYDKITKIEAQILERIQKLKSNNKSYICEHFDLQSSQCQPYSENINYYDKFWKRFLLNQIGKQNLIEVKDKVQNFARKLSKIEGLFNEWQSSLRPIMKVKRRNRKNEEGEKESCVECGKAYKDQQTLRIHRRIKHSLESQNQLKQEAKQMQIYEQQGVE